MTQAEARTTGDPVVPSWRAAVASAASLAATGGVVQGVFDAARRADVISGAAAWWWTSAIACVALILGLAARSRLRGNTMRTAALEGVTFGPTIGVLWAITVAAL